MTPGDEAGRAYRVLMAKAGLDGHNRGVHVILRCLVDAGFEVVYLGLRSTPEEIAGTAVDEDVDCVGISILSGAHRTILPKVRSLLDTSGGAEIPLIAGGIISDVDATWLKGQGIHSVFGPGTSLAELSAAIEAVCSMKRTGAIRTDETIETVT